MTTIETVEFIDTLKQFTGTEFYYEHKIISNHKLLLTDGCNYIREKAKAYWLFDLILSYQFCRNISKETFQVWKLKKQINGTWQINCTDGNDKLLVTQDIEYSDFPIEEITIWVEGKVALLPSEH